MATANKPQAEPTYNVLINVRIPAVTLQAKTALEGEIMAILALYPQASLNTAIMPLRETR